MVCGCPPEQYGDCHGDIRKITALNVQGSADATGLPLSEIVANLQKSAQQLATDMESTKSQADPDVSGVVVKSADEQRYTLTVAYPANKPDVAIAQDGHRDFASAEAVEKAAWSYLRQSPRIGLWHKDGTDGAGTVCESYIYRGPDWHISAPDGSEQVIKSGDWLMGIIWDESSWPLVKQGLIGGVSPQGRARRRTPTPAALAQLRS